MFRLVTIAAVGLVCVGCAMNCEAARTEVLLTDLSKLVDADRLSHADRNAWRALPYECERFSGVMLGEGGGPDFKPITLRLGREGLYRIHVGLYGGYGLPVLQLRLSGDEAAETLEVPPALLRGGRVHESSSTVYEAEWKDADLTGRDLILESAHGHGEFPAALAFLRLEPIDAVGAEPAPAAEPEPASGIDPTRKVAYPLAVTEDGHGIFGAFVQEQPEDLLKPFDRVPEGSCLRMLLWGNGEADICNYPTKVGNEREHSGFRDGWYQRWNANVERWKQDGWNSMQVVCDYARKRGWELQVYIRMEAFKSPFPFDRMVRSDFFEAHPEYHCLDRHGERIVRLSYAYPEVQEHMLALFKEISEYGPNGVCLCFIRGVPLVAYEPIMVEGFMKKYGVDPRQLGETDRRWLDYQGEVLTAFVAKVKKILKPDQRLSAIVPGNRFDCEKWGLDVAAWVKAGIIDDLFPTGQIFSDFDVHLDGPENLDFRYFNHLAGREKIRLMPMLYPWTKFNQDYEGWRADIRSFLEQGADGYVSWDSLGSVSRIGDLGYERIGPDKRPKPRSRDPRKIVLKTLQGFRMDRYHYFEVI